MINKGFTRKYKGTFYQYTGRKINDLYAFWSWKRDVKKNKTAYLSLNDLVRMGFVENH